MIIEKNYDDRKKLYGYQIIIMIEYNIIYKL